MQQQGEMIQNVLTVNSVLLIQQINCECIHGWVITNARQEDGLLDELIWSAWPYRPHRIQRFFFGSGAAAPDTSPGKSLLRK